MLLAEQGAHAMRYCLIYLLNSGIPCVGVAASVFGFPALGPTAVVALMMPLAFFFFFNVYLFWLHCVLVAACQI